MRDESSRRTDYHALDRVTSGLSVRSVYFVVGEDLEKEVPEVSSRTDVAEDGGQHGLVIVGTESIDEVVVVQHVHHGDGAVCSTESSSSPHLAVVTVAYPRQPGFLV